MDFHKFSHCKKLKNLKKDLNGNLCVEHKKIAWGFFSKHALPRPKMGLLNLDIHQYSYSEWLIHSKRHPKRSLYIEFEEYRLSHILLRESLPKPKIGLPHLNFHNFICIVNDYYFRGNFYIAFEGNCKNCCLETRTSEN